MPSLSASDLAGLSPETLEQIQQIANTATTSTTVALFPISTFVYFLILYLSAKIVEHLFQRWSAVYRHPMTHANRRTSVIYILNIICTTIALILQLFCSSALVQRYTAKGLDCLKVSGVIICGLYLFELTYRESMRPQMLMHHFATIFAMCFVILILTKTGHPSMIVTGYVWLFQATTEQLSFVALLLYRLEYSARLVMWLLRAAALQTLIPKMAFSIYLIVWWALHQEQNHAPLDIGWSVVLWVSVSVLMVTQVYGCYILWKVGDSVMRRAAAGGVAGENGADEEKGSEWDDSLRGSTSKRSSTIPEKIVLEA